MVALAATSSYPAAAELLGISRQAFCNRIWLAREAFFRWWHQHETPSKLWREDRRDAAWINKDTAARMPGTRHPKECACGFCVRLQGHAAQPCGRPAGVVAGRVAGWPLAELVAFRRAELGLSTRAVAERVREVAARAGKTV